MTFGDDQTEGDFREDDVAVTSIFVHDDAHAIVQAITGLYALLTSIDEGLRWQQEFFKANAQSIQNTLDSRASLTEIHQSIEREVNRKLAEERRNAVPHRHRPFWRIRF